MPMLLQTSNFRISYQLSVSRSIEINEDLRTGHMVSSSH
ncbi:major capsid-like protein [Salmonella phage 19]|nr:major capsid-like protein [Salmonella phage 19]